MQVLASQLHFLTNRNAGLAIPPLLWPVNYIKIAGHVALLSGPTVHFLYCVIHYVILCKTIPKYVTLHNSNSNPTVTFQEVSAFAQKVAVQVLEWQQQFTCQLWAVKLPLLQDLWMDLKKLHKSAKNMSKEMMYVRKCVTVYIQTGAGIC